MACFQQATQKLLKDYTPLDFQRKFGIKVKESKGNSFDLEQIGLQGIDEQVPIFIEKLYLSGKKQLKIKANGHQPEKNIQILSTTLGTQQAGLIVCLRKIKKAGTILWCR
jgi:hypothetical protein